MIISNISNRDSITSKVFGGRGEGLGGGEGTVPQKGFHPPPQCFLPPIHYTFFAMTLRPASIPNTQQSRMAQPPRRMAP